MDGMVSTRDRIFDIAEQGVELVRHVRRKYACQTCEDGVKIAPPPRKAVF